LKNYILNSLTGTLLISHTHTYLILRLIFLPSIFFPVILEGKLEGFLSNFASSNLLFTYVREKMIEGKNDD